MKKLFLIFCILGMEEVAFGQYLPLAGGTLTGALTGTTATFSNNAGYNNGSGGAGIIYSNATFPGKKIFSGYDGSIDAGFVQAIDFGIEYKNYLINPNGGNVGIGTTNPTNKLSLIEDGASPYSNNGTTLLQLKRNTSNGSTTGRTTLLIGNNSNCFSLGYGGTSDRLSFVDGGNLEVMSLVNGGNIGIGTISPSEKLSVNGKIRAKEIKVETGWADFVFKPDYKLLSLRQIEQYIKKHGHLPEIPSAKEVEEDGVFLGEMNAKLLQKIEELTLHLIEQNKLIHGQNKRIEKLESSK